MAPFPLADGHWQAFDAGWGAWNSLGHEGPHLFWQEPTSSQARMWVENYGADRWGWMDFPGDLCGASVSAGWRQAVNIHVNTWALNVDYPSQAAYHGSNSANYLAYKRIGLFAHELGHGFGLADERDNWKSRQCSQNAWGIMGFPYSHNAPWAPFDYTCGWKAPTNPWDKTALDMRY